MAHPNIYPIWDLLENVKGLVLQINTRRISMTWVGLGISQRSFGEGLVMMVCQKPETLD